MSDPRPQLAATLKDNIARLRAREEEEARAAPLSARIARRVTDFTGSIPFVVVHVLVYGAWIAINVGLLPGVPRFDPTFVILAMEASVEAIFLSTFVLIAQNRMQANSDRRADLDLHVNLLAEHELTRIAVLVERIATHAGVEVADPDFAEVKRDLEPSMVLDAIDAPPGGSERHG
jgi:uncharacterized membrane protein